MIFKNLFRRKGRTTLTLVGISIVWLPSSPFHFRIDV